MFLFYTDAYRAYAGHRTVDKLRGLAVFASRCDDGVESVLTGLRGLELSAYVLSVAGYEIRCEMFILNLHLEFNKRANTLGFVSEGPSN